MTRLMAVACFSALLGLISGLYLAHLEHADADAHTIAQLEASTAALTICQEANRQWAATSKIEGDVTLMQYRLLEQVQPIVSRAYPLWPWGAPEAATGAKGDKP